MAKRIFSGVQPTGNVHLGNYLGALRNWVNLQHEYESFFCIVNLHAITSRQDPKLLAEKSRELARIYLAVGIDPELSTIFIQSDAPEHTELTWILNCIARMSELERMTQFKDKVRKQQENVAVGVFDYPVLMAADILLYQTDLVPVGEDQKQHLELTRDLAIRFNRDYGETFRVPDPFIPKVGARIMSLSNPANKMSKSDDDANGCVRLLDDADSIQRKFKRAVTDSGTEIKFDPARPAITNLLTIYQLMTGQSPEEIEAHFADKGYAQLKQGLADATIEFLQPLQERARTINDDDLTAILEKGANRARRIAAVTLANVKAKMGLSDSSRRN
ncbi:MAG TPA: tryptophan--tRNA ligase [Pyrinomonadaceae bacterium]|jgi:tryptophanyl-tRNA synthetase|nr:tryptophan--tRNA ligase [Pyrinomonadaceae bacterium]